MYEIKFQATMNKQTIYQSISLENSLKWLKHHALHETKHLTHGLDANKAFSYVSCFITISAACFVLYFT